MFEYIVIFGLIVVISGSGVAQYYYMKKEEDRLFIEYLYEGIDSDASEYEPSERSSVNSFPEPYEKQFINPTEDNKLYGDK